MPHLLQRNMTEWYCHTGDGAAPVKAKMWATRGLRSGDLTALASVAYGARPSDGELVGRLEQRSFARKRRDGSIGITLHGRLALLIKRFAMR